jgi:uncharacterized protein (TIGR03083 family)
VTVIDPMSEIDPIRRRQDASKVARAAYDQLFDLLEDLSPAEWAASTECAGWTVRDMAGHMLFRVQAGVVDDLQGVDGVERIAAPSAVAGRMRMPAPMRAITVPLSAGGSTASGMPRSVNLGHLADVVAEWARRHGQPLDLILTGPAGGHFRSPDFTGDA